MLRVEFIDSIDAISASDWHKVFASRYPFTQHGFLAALEQSGSTAPKTGWQPKHLLVYFNQQLIAAMPGYIKQHSYGEYIFDWAWADAYHQYGYHFYPKIVFAIPFTPATGPRLSIIPSHQHRQTEIIELISQALTPITAQLNLSSWQILFSQKAISDNLKAQGWLQRNNIQFHWHNKGYQNFNDFLATFSSRKRKKLIKERQKVQQSNVTIRQIKGPDITDAQWQQFFTFYQATYIKRSGNMGYLNLEFFKQIGRDMAENIMMVVAVDNGGDSNGNSSGNNGGNSEEKSVNDEKIVAAALYFYDKTHLFGRYWGCLKHFDMLHFECCYYQGIEFCIQNNLQTFDAGAQGEHKIARGFEPVQTYANYRIINSQFNRAIANYIEEEWQHNLAYLEAAKEKLPFKKREF